MSLTFKSISMSKLRDYLRQSDFEEYLRRPNRTSEQEFVREKLVENDFAVRFDHIGWIMAAISLIKFGLFVIGE